MLINFIENLFMRPKTNESHLCPEQAALQSLLDALWFHRYLGAEASYSYLDNLSAKNISDLKEKKTTLLHDDRGLPYLIFIPSEKSLGQLTADDMEIHRLPEYNCSPFKEEI